MKRTILAVALLLLTAACATLPSNYVSFTGDRPQKLALSEVLPSLKGKRVIFIGEAHTDEDDHLVQLEVIKYLVSQGARPAIALEMFPAVDQRYLDMWNQGRMSEAQFAGFYASRWNVPYSIYSDIFEYARQHKLPLIGVNAKKGFILSVGRNGISRLPAKELNRINFTPCTADPEYTAMVRGGFAAHDANFTNFCNAERMRDYVMAWHVSQLARQKSGPVVVLLGAAHASKRAVPLLMEKDLTLTSHGLPYAVLEPRHIKYLLGKEPDQTVADYIWY